MYCAIKNPETIDFYVFFELELEKDFLQCLKKMKKVFAKSYAFVYELCHQPVMTSREGHLIK